MQSEINRGEKNLARTVCVAVLAVLCVAGMCTGCMGIGKDYVVEMGPFVWSKGGSAATGGSAASGDKGGATVIIREVFEPEYSVTETTVK